MILAGDIRCGDQVGIENDSSVSHLFQTKNEVQMALTVGILC